MKIQDKTQWKRCLKSGDQPNALAVTASSAGSANTIAPGGSPTGQIREVDGMTLARRYLVSNRARRNKAKPESEAGVQARFVKWVTPRCTKCLDEVDYGRGVTDVLALFPPKDVSVFEVKGKRGNLVKAIQQTEKRGAHYRWVVCPERNIGERVSKWLEFFGVGLIFEIKDKPGEFKVAVSARRQRMSRKSHRSALAHFEETNKCI